jgi:hypothetical protein
VDSISIGSSLSKAPDFVDDRVFKIWAGVACDILVVQPGIVRSVEHPMDLIHHTSEGVPTNPAFDPFSVELHQITNPVPKLTFPSLLDHLCLYTIRGFHTNLQSSIMWSSKLLRK